MSTFVMLIGVVIALGLGYLLFDSQMKKSYLLELEKQLEMKQFQLKSSIVKTTVTGIWKNVRVEVEANLAAPKLPSTIVYKAEHRSKFTADITPGEGLLKTFQAEAEAKDKPKDDPDSFKPWRPKLTEEEKSVIDQRRSTDTQEVIVPKEMFKIISAKPDDVKNYLESEGRDKAIVELFRNGFTRVEVDFTEVTITKYPYDIKDMQPKAVEECFKVVKGLINNRVEV